MDRQMDLVTDHARFSITFEKASQTTLELWIAKESIPPDHSAIKELEEIDELRRLALALAEPQPASYTTTYLRG